MRLDYCLFMDHATPPSGVTMPQFLRDFHEHPQSVGETYLGHWCSAMRFGLILGACALACLVHAFLPGLFKCSASQCVTRLHEQMVTHRRRAAPACATS